MGAPAGTCYAAPATLGPNTHPGIGVDVPVMVWGAVHLGGDGDQVHLEVRGGDQLDGPAGAVALDLGLAGGCFSRPWRKATSFARFWPAYWQSIASTSPMSMPPMPKSPSSTDPHGHCEAQKVVGIDGSLVAAQIRLSSPWDRARANNSGGRS